MLQILDLESTIAQSFYRVARINITPDMLARAESFAEQVIKTIGARGYDDANQTNLEKIKTDHAVSKIGEEAVRNAFEQLGLPVMGPDYEIYERINKSWDADLKVAGVDVAVKTQTHSAALRFGLSWTFADGQYRRDPILNQPDAWVAFVLYNQRYLICTVYPPVRIRDLEFGEPKLERLKASKKVVYVESLF